MRLPPLPVWAARDAFRRPGEFALAASALAAVVFVVAVPVLVHQGLEAVGRRALVEAPDLVVRRIAPAGFLPVPVDEGVAALRGVRGVTGVYPRAWGVLPAPVDPVMVVAAGPGSAAEGPLPTPAPGEAVVGRGIAREPGGTLEIAPVGGGIEPFRVAAVLPAAADLVAHDLVLLHPADAARVLGLAAGTATDLAVRVFHEAEADAIRPALQAALPWPARITSRSEAGRSLSGALARAGSVGVAAAVPAVLALVLLIVASFRAGAARAPEAALFRSLGWTTADLVRLGLWRSLVPGAAGVALGLALALAVAVWPGVPALIGPWLGTGGRDLALGWDAGGLLLAGVEVAAAVLAPWVVAALWPALRQARSDPADLLEDR